MADYRKPYFTLFNAITDALRQMAQDEPYAVVRNTMVAAQQAAEELVISQPDPEDTVTE